MNGKGEINTTVPSFLKNSAIRITDDFGFDEDSVDGIEWNSSYSNPPENIEGIKGASCVTKLTVSSGMQ